MNPFNGQIIDGLVILPIVFGVQNLSIVAEYFKAKVFLENHFCRLIFLFPSWLVSREHSNNLIEYAVNFEFISRDLADRTLPSRKLGFGVDKKEVFNIKTREMLAKYGSTWVVHSS